MCFLSGHTLERGAGYSLHQLQGDKGAGVSRSGHLLEKSEDIFHADETKTPTRVNLLTCQIKMVADDKRSFDLVSYATWLCTNFEIVICIECSGVHRDLGVHISRVQSLTLDHVGTSQLLLARYMTNQVFNEIMEATLIASSKSNPSSTMEERCEFIRAKYVEKKYASRSRANEKNLLNKLEHAVNNKSLSSLLQVFAEGVDLSAPLPSSDCGETALHLAIK
ncbi:hypothetical protein PGB90_008251 [Kerria lacca]